MTVTKAFHLSMKVMRRARYMNGELRSLLFVYLPCWLRHMKEGEEITKRAHLTQLMCVNRVHHVVLGTWPGLRAKPAPLSLFCRRIYGWWTLLIEPTVENSHTKPRVVSTLRRFSFPVRDARSHQRSPERKRRGSPAVPPLL